MTVKLLTEHDLEFLYQKEAAQASLSLYLSTGHIVGNHMLWLKLLSYFWYARVKLVNNDRV